MSNNLFKTPTAGEGPTGDKYDAIFGVLADQRRRRSLRYIIDSDTSVTVDDLTEALATWESESAVTDAAPGERAAIRTSLLHNHLPRMDEANLVAYDRPERTATAASYTDETRAQFEAMQR